jgi:Ca2+-binding RTX toxin-like protein
MTTNSSFIAEVVTLTNQFRAQNGLAPLTLNAELSNTAQFHSQDMAQQDYFDHTGKNGSSPWDRAAMFGFGGNTYMGENIAAGQTTPQQVVNGWINSPGHRANMLNANFTQIGVGYEFLANDTGTTNYFHYWTQFFGGADGNSATGSLGSTLVGTANADTLTGTAANDLIYGNGGNDSLTGSGGSDLLAGGGGADRLAGGIGNDYLTGEGGNDQFRFTSPQAFSAANFGVDRITDFVKGSDKIVLKKTTFGNVTAGQVAIVSSDNQVNTSAGLIVYSTGTGNLFYNQNGAAAGLGTGAQFAKVYTNNNSSSIPALAASDFTFI